MQKVSRKGYRKGVLVQEGGGFLCRKGSRSGSRKGFPVLEGGFLWVSKDSSWPGKGGVPVQKGGSCGVPVARPVHILPSQFLACFHFKCNAKGCCQFPWQCRSSDPVLGSGG